MANFDTSYDTLVILGPPTQGGHTLFAKNGDRPPTECQPLFQAPRLPHPQGATLRCQYIAIPQASETLAILGSRPWWLWGFEHGVNGCTSRHRQRGTARSRAARRRGTPRYGFGSPGLGRGLTVKGIKAAKLKRLPIAVPSLAEQRRIVAKVDELMALCNELETRLTTTVPARSSSKPLSTKRLRGFLSVAALAVGDSVHTVLDDGDLLI